MGSVLTDQLGTKEGSAGVSVIMFVTVSKTVGTSFLSTG